MANHPANPRSGGIFIAIGAIGGVLVGRLYGEPTMGLIVGVATGVALALALWLKDRRT